MTRIRDQQTPSISLQTLMRHQWKLNDKSLERNRSLRNQDYFISTATMTIAYEFFYNFHKILFYNEYFLFHAKLKNSLINFGTL